MDDVIVCDLDGLTIASGCKTNLIGHLALTMVGLLNRAVIYTFHGHHSLSRISMDRVLIAVEFRVVALAVPVHAELICRHLVSIGARRIVCLVQLRGLP